MIANIEWMNKKTFSKIVAKNELFSKVVKKKVVNHMCLEN